MPGGGTVSVMAAQGRPYSFVCGALADKLGIPPAPPVYESLPYQNLRITLNAQPTVRAGDVLHYTLTLANPTTSSIPLSPCPGYTVALIAGSSSSYELNCAAAGPIAPGGTETFAMELPIPASAPHGTMSLNLVFVAAATASSPPMLIGPRVPPFPVTVTVTA